MREIEVLPIYYDHVLTKNYPIVVLVGGRNSGKSFFMEQLGTINMHNKKNYKLLVIEDVETNVGEGVKNGIENRIGEFGYDPLFKSTKVPATIEHKLTGSSTIFRGYHSEDQQKRVKSLNEVTAAWYEEAENITYNQFKALRMQLRGGNEEDRQLFLTLNPINEDGFVCQYFFNGEADKIYERFDDGRPKVFEKHINVDLEDGTIVNINCICIVTTYRDNPYLTPEQRADIEELKYTDIDQYEMLANGKFVKGKGVYFNEFNKHIHTVEPKLIPQEYRVYRFLDYGLDKLACYWVSVDYQGKSLVYKELWESDLIISDAAKKIKAMTNEDVYETFAPPDLWNRRQDTGKSAAEIFWENGVPLSKVSNDFELGCFALKEWLKVYETKDEQTGQVISTSDLTISTDCPNLIESLNSILKDSKNPNVYAKTPHELSHSVDALRYYAAGNPRATTRPAEPKHYNFEFEKPPKNPLGKGEKVRVI